jgi:predicted dehydrogenase
MKQMKKIGIIGAGFVARFHLQALRFVRGAEVAAIYALQGAKELADMARDLGVGSPVVCDSVADLCQKVDIVGVFVPNFAREETIRAIVESGANVAVVAEKPLARNVAEANRILDWIGKRPILTGYFENQIFMPTIAAARAQIRGLMKRMGPVSLVRTAEEHGGPHEPWFWDPTRQGGGVFCDMGCHSVAVGEDLAAAAAGGQLNPISVSATMGLLKWGNDPWLGILQKRGVDYRFVDV